MRQRAFSLLTASFLPIFSFIFLLPSACLHHFSEEAQRLLDRNDVSRHGHHTGCCAGPCRPFLTPTSSVIPHDHPSPTCFYVASIQHDRDDTDTPLAISSSPWPPFRDDSNSPRRPLAARPLVLADVQLAMLRLCPHPDEVA